MLKSTNTKCTCQAENHIKITVCALALLHWCVCLELVRKNAVRNEINAAVGIAVSRVDFERWCARAFRLYFKSVIFLTWPWWFVHVDRLVPMTACCGGGGGSFGSLAGLDWWCTRVCVCVSRLRAHYKTELSAAPPRDHKTPHTPQRQPAGHTAIH